LTTAWAAFTTIAIIYPGIGTAHPDDSLPSGFAGERLQYTLSQVIPLAVMILVGVAFYLSGAPTRRQARVTAAAVAAGTAAVAAPQAEAGAAEGPQE
jgi:hypothetical protein